MAGRGSFFGFRDGKTQPAAIGYLFVFREGKGNPRDIVLGHALVDEVVKFLPAIFHQQLVLQGFPVFRSNLYRHHSRKIHCRHAPGCRGIVVATACQGIAATVASRRVASTAGDRHVVDPHCGARRHRQTGFQAGQVNTLGHGHIKQIPVADSLQVSAQGGIFGLRQNERDQVRPVA